MDFFKNSTRLFAFLLCMQAYSQLMVEAEVRPRFEYRHGFSTLFPDGEDPAAFISQRTRLTTSFKEDRLQFYLSVQDVRVWGDVPQLNASDKNGIAIHQAWGELFFDTTVSLRLGRQEIVYDDHRIFGNVDWAQQARSHDIAVLKYAKNNLKLDLGFAFNQDSEKITGTTLTTPGTYKSLQYGWLHKDWTHFSGSFLFLNNGLQFIDPIDEANNETRFSQTVGGHFKFNKGRYALSSNLYYQFGKDAQDNDVDAHLVSLEIAYNLSDTWKATIGAERISGNTNGAPSNGTNDAFTPFYGTNHKFNGLMDYFFVGNHNGNVGLMDIYGKAKVALTPKSSLEGALHHFAAAADISGTNSRQLGLELDIVYSHSIDKNIQLQAGYSQLFPSDGLEIVKNNTDGNINNWAWIMITLKPTLYKNNN
ncbi:alginate export family protein [Arenibacter sp. GZD96]|uniref:alginate export family protein n=1 Tax=Aurantibrevibacter litoralis TaxID=3106030 RepID=UPI002AFFF6AA|nr:alginate export family protein [Arenibacter sp. GZD-96]MEA1784779.1 alginate export family protein [Arenibacter sp. GZD-96]